MTYESYPSKPQLTPTVLELHPGIEQLTWSDGTIEKRWSKIGQNLDFPADKRPEGGDSTPVMIEVEEWNPERGTETRIIGIANGILVDYERNGKPVNPVAWAHITYGAQRAVGDTAKDIIPRITIGAQLHLPFPGYGASGKVISARALTVLGNRLNGEPTGRNAMGQIDYDEEGSDQWRSLIQATRWMRDGRDTYHPNMDPRAKQPVISSFVFPREIRMGRMVYNVGRLRDAQGQDS